MDNNKMLEKTREALEEHIQLIIRKGGNMTPPDIEILTKDLCALEALKRIEQGESQNSFQANGNSYRRGRGANGQFVSRDSGNSGYYDDASCYGDRGNSAHSRDGGSSNRYYDGNSGYSGHSIQDRMIDQLERMIDEAKTEHERQTVQDWIRRLKD